MNGEDLYNYYRQCAAAEAILVEEEWKDLDEKDQRIWKRLAMMVRRALNK